MIENKLFFDHLKKIEINFFTGVPDSLLKDFCGYITDHTLRENHIITTNEGSSIAMATGYHLATNKVPFVYMQNSGLGNAINPLLSLASNEVYGIPMIIMIGWRGEPGTKDEPQHKKQGLVQEKLLSSLEIPYEILTNADVNSFAKKLNALKKTAISRSCPVVILVKKQTFKKYSFKAIESTKSSKLREDILRTLLKKLPEDSIIVSTTGKTSREIYELRNELKQTHKRDFLTVGSMGHCSQIALGISNIKKNKTIICIDGDGSALMHLGAMTTNGNSNNINFKHILLNNGSHESVGGQPTLGLKINFCDIALACNYKNVRKSDIMSEEDINWFIESEGPVFFEIIIKQGSRSDLGRPKEQPVINKKNFMNSLLD